jgi:Ca2+-binding EF-hand superfamily protein
MFTRLDREGKGLLDSKELLLFLRDNGSHQWSESNAYYLMKFYDTDEDESLDYTDFL